MNTTLSQIKSTSFAWLAAWTIASAIAFVLGMFGTLTLLWSVAENLTNRIPEFAAALIGGAVFGLSIGVLVGIAQWLVLRNHSAEATRWLVGSIIGGTLAGVVAIFISQYNNDGENVAVTLLSFVVLGALVGLGQALAARSVARPAVWTVASAIAFVLAALLTFAMPNQDITWLNSLAGGILYGAVTAAALWWSNR